MQPSIITQRQGTVVSNQTIPITKVVSQGEGQSAAQQGGNVFIHTPVTSLPRRSSPGKHKTFLLTRCSKFIADEVCCYTIFLL